MLATLTPVTMDLVRESVVPPEGPSRVLRRVPRLGTVLRDVAPALAIYAAIRLVGLVVLAVFAGSHGVNGLARLDSFDGPHLLGIAANGYDPLVPPPRGGRPVPSNVAFLPLYPGLVRLVSLLTQISLEAAGFAVTAIAGLAAAAGLDRFGRIVPGGRAAGLILVALWACWPHSIVLAMPYTEGLFVALAAWSLVALLGRRWVAAGLLCLLAGAARPLGTALAGAVVIAALVVVVRTLVEDRRLAWRPLAGAVLAPLGFLAYWGWLWIRTGRPDAWFWVQAHEWGSTFDGGAFTANQIASAASRNSLVHVVVAGAVLVSIVLLIALLAERPPLAVGLYALLGTISVAGAAGYFQSKARFLLCVFPLLVPLVAALARAPRRVTVVLLTGIVLMSAWYNAFVLVSWHRSP